MTRHSKNNTANPIFTYHERQNVRDFNTQRQRLGADSMRRCEQCWLCLSTAVKPVCTLAGYVFCKECILKSCAKQLEEHKRALAKWEADQAAHQMRKAEERELSLEHTKRQLLDTGVYGVTSVKKSIEPSCSNTTTTSDSNFWVAGAPSKRSAEDTATSAPSKLPKGLKCPITGKPIKLKELVDINPDISKDTDNGDPVWLCSVSQRPISHHQAMLNRATGRVVLRRYVEVCDDTANKFIALIPGGTGFAAHNGVVANKYRPALL
ncbi:enos interacting domain containg protein, putative [Babesia ovis]|uniref:Enos interacting domain containg protein, putative n=1 Tax=Babesia ovis TaxID=5869 RepID=A0A9W5WVS6_BABOV|nr:enos interacting domain containg protein, putative [Babesia ovis]